MTAIGLSRRALLAAIVAGFARVGAAPGPAGASARPPVTVYHDPG